MTQRFQERAEIRENIVLKGGYYRVDVAAPRIVPEVQPGQFVHLRLPELEHHVLRRPFSIFNVRPDTGILSIIYKVVGDGTSYLSSLESGRCLDLLGPLGVGYSMPPAEATPIIVAGGYGCAATYLFAARSPVPPICLVGGRSSGDILLEDEFRALGCDVRVSTDDGSSGYRGVVTDLLGPAIDGVAEPFIVACGPNPMLRAVCGIAEARGLDAEVSLDHVMCCGVGACFACVVKMRADNPDGWAYVRTCLEGPVFKASRIHWDDAESLP